MNKSEEGRLQPQNIEAEKSILGAILISEDVLGDSAEKLKPADFYDERHRLIFDAILKLYEKHTPVDLLTLTDQLKKSKDLTKVGGSAYIAELTNYVPTTAHADAYIDLVSQNAVRRRLIAAGAEITELSFNDQSPVNEVLEKAEQKLFNVSSQNIKKDLILIEDILSDSFDRIEELHKNKGGLRGIPTGFTDLDKITAGLQPSDLIILAARPAMGKTTLVTNLAYNVATISKKAVLFFSLEMSKEQLVDRMLADASGIDAWKIRTGNLNNEDFSKISEAMGTMAEAKLMIDDTPGLSVLEMRTKARRAARSNEIGLIVVDYLQLMQATTRSSDGNRVQEVSEISRGLKLLARELNAPVIALSQLSRSVENRRPQIPQLADLRESGSIEQDADIVMFIYREAYYEPETERKNITDLIIAKHRNGPTGRIELYFNPERLRFESADSTRD